MSDRPTSESQPPPTPLPPGVGWYQGPFPPAGWAGNRESIGRALLRRALTAGIVLSMLGVSFFLFIIAIGAIAAVLAGGDDTSSPNHLSSEFVYGEEGSSNKLLSIRINGPILGEDPGGGGLFSLSGTVTYGYSVKEALRKAAADNSIKGVVLELSTPGGTIYGSQAIADGVKAYQAKTGKPVLAFVAGLSASGGMWSMAPADRILADHGSLVGSIGVIMGPFAFYDGVIATEGGLFGGGVTTKNGITQDYITAGRSKDVGNPYRKLTTEERTSLQAGVDTIYAEFVKHVSTNRDISESTIRDTLGAMVFSNAQAQQFGLIDGTASREEAYAEAATLAKIIGTNWQVVREKDSLGGLAGLLADARDSKPPAAQTVSVCFAPNTALAYYGDVAALCPN